MASIFCIFIAHPNIRYMEMMYDVFISYSRKNMELAAAEGLADDLHKIQLNSTVELYLKLEEFYKEINRRLKNKA